MYPPHSPTVHWLGGPAVLPHPISANERKMSALGIKIRPKASRPRSHLKPTAVKVASRYHKTSAIPSYNHTYHTCRPISHLLIAQYIYISDSGAASYAFLAKKADEGWVDMHRRSASIIAYRQRRTRHPSRHRMLTRRISERRNFRRECITTNPSYADNYRELHTHTHTHRRKAPSLNACSITVRFFDETALRRLLRQCLVVTGHCCTMSDAKHVQARVCG